MATIIQSRSGITIDGVIAPKPPKSIFGGSSVMQSSGRVYINGYKYDADKKTFKFSLYGMINHIF